MIQGKGRNLYGSQTALIACGLLFCALSVRATIKMVDSPHNLSSSGPGPTRFLDRDEVCVFCHTPHVSGSEKPLWNEKMQSRHHKKHGSPNVHSSLRVPTGKSKLCLSCHDGTVALGTAGASNQQSLQNRDMNKGQRTDLGVDLSNDHPVSVPYRSLSSSSTALSLLPLSAADPVKLDETGCIQCTSCHDPHDNQYGDFLVMDNHKSSLCLQCHNIPHWAGNAHHTSSARWNGLPPDPWPESRKKRVSDNGCLNCHDIHGAAGKNGLLKNADENEVCLSCHNANVAESDIKSRFEKFSRHPLADSMRQTVSRKWNAALPRYVRCSDCHDPHNVTTAPSGNVIGKINASPDDALLSLPLSTATKNAEYRLCSRCHGEPSEMRKPYIPRQIIQTNVQREFDTDNPSYHPIEAAGKNPDVPSLIPPLNEKSRISCTGCHADDDSSPNASGRSGPHGSRYAPLLQKKYETMDFAIESSDSYALCYKCHDRNILLSDLSAFPLHRLHVVDSKTPCAACHDPHGISAEQGNSLNNSRLINFNLRIAFPHANGQLRFLSHRPRSGNCTLFCHGKTHTSSSYGAGTKIINRHIQRPK